MAKVNSCLKFLTFDAGTATLPVTSIVDPASGNAFKPSAAIVLGGGTLNTIETFWRFNTGIADRVTGFGASGMSVTAFASKIVHASGGTSPILRTADTFGITESRVAAFSNFATGSVDVTRSTNTASGDTIAILFLGGTTLEAVVQAGSGSAKQTTSFAPDVVLFHGGSTAAVGSTTGGCVSLGYATRDGQQGLTTAGSFQLASNSRYQRSTKCSGGLVDPAAVTNERAIVSFDSDGVTLDGSLSSSGASVLALGGCSGKGLTAQVPASTGSISLSTGIKVRALILLSSGRAPSSSLSSDEAAFSWGATDGSAQAAFWTSEDHTFSATANGAHKLSNADVLILGTVNAGSSTIHTRVQLTSMNQLTGEVLLNASVVSGNQEEFLVLAIGEPVGNDLPVDYEDPCEITEPRIIQTLNTGTELLKVSTHPLRDASALGGFAEPRLLEAGPVSRIASDPVTGAWSAQTASTRWADTDRATRARSETRTSFRKCSTELYITSNARRAAGGLPRCLFAGEVYADTADANLVHSQQLNDLIGASYSLFAEEKQIPQRTIAVNWFPNAPEASIGVGEPIVGGRRAPLDPARNGQGVSVGVYVGQVRIGGAHGTPTGTDLASVVAALEASRAAGTLYTDYGSRIGYADALTLQGMSSVPSDYDALAAVIGYSDLDALLAETAHTGGDVFEAVVVASHAIAEILDGVNGEPSIWVGDTQVAAADIGVSVWAPQIPGDTSWASDIGSDLFTDVLGADGVTRRYTLILFDPGGTHGLAVAGGAQVHVDCIGLEDVGDGTGDPITDYFELYRHVLVNFILQDYQSGAWLSVPQFTYSDGSTLIDRVDAASFTSASAVAALSLSGGRLGSFTINDRTSVRDVIATFNLCGGCRLAEDDFGRLRCQVLDVRRTNFLTNAAGDVHRTLKDKRDFLPGFWIEPKPEWQVNLLRYQYALNGSTNDYERGGDGSAAPTQVEDVTSQERDGVLKKTIALPYVSDDATATDVATYYLDLFKNLPHVAHYARRGLCGLEDDVLDGVPITHFNGYGSAGWVDHAVWILSKTFHPKTMHCEFTALDVEARIVEAETPELDPLMLDPVALDALYDDVSGDPLYADT